MFLALLDLICIICHDWVIFKWLCQLNSKVDSFNINSYCLFKPKNKIFLILDLICWFTMLREWFASGCVCWISTIGPSSSLRNQTGLLQSTTIKEEGLKKEISSITESYTKLARFSITFSYLHPFPDSFLIELYFLLSSWNQFKL